LGKAVQCRSNDADKVRNEFSQIVRERFMGWQDWFKDGSGQKGTSADTRADRDPSWNQNGSNSGMTEGSGGFTGGAGISAGVAGSAWGTGADSGGGNDRIAETGRDDRYSWSGGQSGGDGWGYGGGVGGSSGGGDTWGTPGRDPWSNPSRDPYSRD